MTALVLVGGAGCARVSEGGVTTDGQQAVSSTTSTTAGSTSGDPGQGAADLGRLTPAASAEYLSKAADRTTAAGTGRFTMAVSMSGLPGTTGTADVMSMRGEFDTAAKRAHATLDMSGMSSVLGGVTGSGGAAGGKDPLGLGEALGGMFSEPMEMVTDGGTTYLRWPLITKMAGVTTPWISMELPAGSGGTSPGGFTADSGAALLEFLKGAGVDVAQVGTETVDGVATTHYHATLDLKDLATKVPEAQRRGVEQQLDQLKAVTVPVDVWIGNDDNRVRRMQLVMDFSQLGGLGSLGGAGRSSTPTGAMTMTLDFTDLGAPVDIAVPPADQVTHESSDSLLGGLGGLQGGKAGGSTRRGTGRTTTTI